MIFKPVSRFEFANGLNLSVNVDTIIKKSENGDRYWFRIRIRNVFYSILTKSLYKVTMITFRIRGPSLVANIGATYYIINTFFSYNMLKIHNKVNHEYVRMSQ